MTPEEWKQRFDELRRRQTAAEDEIKKIGEELALLRYPELKPPDFEPLECYINVVYAVTDPLDGTKALQAYWTKEEAIEPVYGGPTRTQAGVRMREVTPEMVQDELDAKRYRKLKDLHCATAPDWIYTPWQWDRQLDKAMEK